MKTAFGERAADGMVYLVTSQQRRSSRSAEMVTRALFASEWLEDAQDAARNAQAVRAGRVRLRLVPEDRVARLSGGRVGWIDGPCYKPEHKPEPEFPNGSVQGYWP